eukprot:20195-Pelagococcus_subviridis.AAC.2
MSRHSTSIALGAPPSLPPSTSSRSVVTPFPLSPHGTMASNHRKSTSRLNANPCDATPRDICTPTAPSFFPLAHTPVISGTLPVARTPKLAAASIMTSSNPSTYARAPSSDARRSTTG